MVIVPQISGELTMDGLNLRNFWVNISACGISTKENPDQIGQVYD